jgi:glycosyltransferase involved in cell wall biosynthesis
MTPQHIESCISRNRDDCEVTVVIPTYNRSLLLLEALASVFSQTFQNFEVVIVDDGSTDDTASVLKPHASQLHYVKLPHGGEASARNRGIREARTRYVAFLDSDDLWEPQFLESVIGHLNKHPEIALVSTVCQVFPGGMRRPRLSSPIVHGHCYPLLYARNLVTASAVVVKRSCFEQIGFFNETLDQATDYDMWLRIAKIYQIAILNEPLCRWRAHTGNASRSEVRHRECALQVVSAHSNHPSLTEKLRRSRRSRLLTSLGRAYLKAGDLDNASRCFSESVTQTPYRFRSWQYLVLAWIRRTWFPYKRSPHIGHRNSS